MCSECIYAVYDATFVKGDTGLLLQTCLCIVLCAIIDNLKYEPFYCMRMHETTCCELMKEKEICTSKKCIDSVVSLYSLFCCHEWTIKYE